MVDPQWDIWYWGSKLNLNTVCWSAVGCEWGTTSIYFGITYVCFVPSRLPVFAVEPQYLLEDFLFLSKVSFEGHIQNLQKIHVGLKFEWGLKDQYWLSCERLAFEVFLSCLFDGPLGIAYANMLATTQWPLEACSPPHLTCLGLCSIAAWKLNGPICAMFKIRQNNRVVVADLVGYLPSTPVFWVEACP